MGYDVFISHSSKDKLTADAICHAMEQNGVSCWIAPRDIRGGREYGEEIISGIENCKLTVLVFSEHSNDSPYVKSEIERAFSKNKIIIPYRLSNIEMSRGLEFFLAGKHWIDAYPSREVFDNLVAAAKNALGMGIIKGSSELISSEQPEKKKEDRKNLWVRIRWGLLGAVIAIVLFAGWGIWLYLSDTDSLSPLSPSENIDGREAESAPAEPETVVLDLPLGKYTGPVNDSGQPHGFGEMEYNDGDSAYIGYFENGNRHGRGVFVITNGDSFDSYDGDWQDDKAYGYGTYLFADGGSYKGEWQDNKKHGKGVRIYSDSNSKSYDGDWKDDKRHGYGILLFTNGNSYDGEWQDDNYNGYGIFKWESGQSWEGQWVNSLREGSGIYTDAEGRKWNDVRENDERISVTLIPE